MSQGVEEERECSVLSRNSCIVLSGNDFFLSRQTETLPTREEKSFSSIKFDFLSLSNISIGPRNFHQVAIFVCVIREYLVSLDEEQDFRRGRVSSKFLLPLRLRSPKIFCVRDFNERTPCWSFTPRRLVLSIKIPSRANRANLCRRFHLFLSDPRQKTIMQVRTSILITF